MKKKKIPINKSTLKGDGRTTCYGCGKRLTMLIDGSTGYCDSCWWEKCKRIFRNKNNEVK